MNLEEMRSAQADLRARYRETPAAARVTLHSRGRLVEDFGCALETGAARTVAGMHPGVGGSGSGACPGDMLLEALATCAGVTLNAAAAGMGIALRSASVEAEGDLDFRAVMGMSNERPIGFAAIRLRFDPDASDAQL